ncbi:MAG: hypothetical protein QG599_2446 [Pseudomonadota bacterium]|nr:hypothetical protein [Pseudomonadota bacterium]
MNELHSAEAVRVWDPFVRIFHWSLVICVLVNYFVIDDGETIHQWLGYTASALIVARIIWGFVGSQYARFSDFFPTPTRLRQHVHNLLTHQQDDYPGHNPVGALMMFALMALVLAMGVTGFMQTLDAFWGEEWLLELHEVLASLLILGAGFHALAAIIMSYLERTNLIKAMWTGVKVRSRLKPSG